MPTSLERIDIDKETLGHALIDRRLDVPKNQRSYAWEEEHISDLYKDLAGEINAGNPEYFLGSIVAVATSSPPRLLSCSGNLWLPIPGAVIAQHGPTPD